MSELKLEQTEFPCPLCGMILSFKIDDPRTYLSRTEHERYFGMQLATYRVVHHLKDERHVVSVLVDHAGYYRGLIDAFSEKIEMQKEKITPDERWIVVATDGLNELVPQITGFEFFIYLNEDRREIIPLHHSSKINLLELSTILLERLNEARRLYDEHPSRLNVNVADKKVQLWIKNGHVLAINVLKEKIIPVLDAWLAMLLDEEELLTQLQHHKYSITLALQIISQETVLPSDAKLLMRLITDDLLFTKVSSPYLDRFDRIVERVSREYPIARNVLGSILRGEKTVIDVLADDRYQKNVSDILAMIDFINRRKLLE